MDNFKWDIRFLRMAKEVASWSKDPSTKVGAVVANQKKFVSAGYNGFPPEIEDKPEDLNNREVKLSKTKHAEWNAIKFAERPIEGYTIYTWPLMPCCNCAEEIVKARIKRVVSLNNDNPRWQESFVKTRELLKKNNIELELYDGPQIGL